MPRTKWRLEGGRGVGVGGRFFSPAEASFAFKGGCLLVRLRGTRACLQGCQASVSIHQWRPWHHTKRQSPHRCQNLISEPWPAKEPTIWSPLRDHNAGSISSIPLEQTLHHWDPSWHDSRKSAERTGLHPQAREIAEPPRGLCSSGICDVQHGERVLAPLSQFGRETFSETPPWPIRQSKKFTKSIMVNYLSRPVATDAIRHCHVERAVCPWEIVVIKWSCMSVNPFLSSWSVMADGATSWG